MKIFLSILISILASCSFKKSANENQTLKGHSELYSKPSEPDTRKLREFEKRVVIASTNDIHGNYQTQKVVFKDEHSKHLQSTNIGGIDTIENYFKILRETYENVLLVDSGDIFSGASSTNTVRDFYSLLRYDAITVGLSDFNLKLPSDVQSSSDFFKKFAKSSKTSLLLSNLYELKSARVVEWEGTRPYTLKDFGGVKVGIIGLIPDDIPTQTPVNNRVGLFVESMIQSTLRNARLLRSLGADIIVVLTHQGIDCNTELALKSKLPVMKVNFDPKKSTSCELRNSLGIYLERLPPQLVDVVIGGRNHQKMANFVNGTLVLGGFPDGKSFNFAEFIVDTKAKKIIHEETVVHQPIFFCHEFFKETNDCFTEDSSVNHKERTPATFLGKKIETMTVPEEGVVLNKEVTRDLEKSVIKGLVSFTADISFISETSGHTQLYILAIQGKDLMSVLEEDYNRGIKKEWFPSPFIAKDDALKLLIGGLDIERGRIYRILTDLESMQTHSRLIKNLTHEESQSLKQLSWNSFNQEEADSINSKMAAPTR